MRQCPTAGIIAHAVLPYPENTDTCVTNELHGAMRHLCPRSEEQDTDRCGGHKDRPAIIRHGNGAVLTIQNTVLKVEKCHAIADLRQRLKLRADHTGQVSHATALPRPMS